MAKSKLVWIAIAGVLALSACSRVEPNQAGVLQENYGKNGKSDFSLQRGTVWTLSPGAELYQVPLWEQRGEFNDALHLKASDNTEFTSKPSYSYKVIPDMAVDVVFNNRQLGSGDKFLDSLEDNVLEARVYNILKDTSRQHTTDELMQNGGSLKLEQEVQDKVRDEFKKAGLELLTFTAQLEFSDKVRERIDTRNEVNQNISVLDQKISEQKKRNELAELEAQELLIRSKGLTPQILQEKFIDAWGGKQPIYGDLPIMKSVQ